MAIKNFGRHVGQTLVSKFVTSSRLILWVLFVSIALLFLSTTAVYASGIVDNTDISGTDAPPHEQISGEGESTNPEVATLTDEEQAKLNELLATEPAPTISDEAIKSSIFNVDPDDYQGFDLTFQDAGEDLNPTTYPWAKSSVKYACFNAEDPQNPTAISPYSVENIYRDLGAATNSRHSSQPIFDSRFYYDTYRATPAGGSTHTYAFYSCQMVWYNSSDAENNPTSLSMTRFYIAGNNVYYQDE